MSKQPAIQLDAFEVTIADINSVSLDRLHALSISVGWPHREEDWQLLREYGHGVVTVDKIGRVLGSAMWFPHGEDFASIGMVITTPRLQANGAGRRLMDYAMAQNRDRHLGLNATAQALRLYVSLGFKLKAPVRQRQGSALAPLQRACPPQARLRIIEASDLAELSALDQRAYGADRQALLARLLPLSKGVALVRDGRIEAFALCRKFGRGHVLGPIVAANDDDAVAVAQPHVNDHVGTFLRVDTRQLGGAFAEFLEEAGLTIYDTVNSMWMGRPWPTTGDAAEPQAPISYGLASHTLG